MAKNYILKKEDAVFIGVNNDLLQYDIIGSPNICPQLSGSTVEIDGEKFLYAVEDEGGVLFTRDGVEPTSQPEEDVSVSYDPEVSKLSFYALLKKYPDMQDGTQYTLPLYIYTGEDDPIDTVDPISKNAAYSNYSHHDLEGIDYLMDDILGLKTEDDSEEETPAEDNTDEEPPVG